MVPTTDFESWETDPGTEEYGGLVSLQEISRAEERLRVSRNVIAIAAALLALQEYCHRDEIRIDYLNSNRTDTYLQHTVGLIFKIFPLAVDLSEFASTELLLQEVNRQVVEGLAHSICDYSSVGNIALDDALVVNYVADIGNVSGMQGITQMDLDMESSYEATGSHVEIYLIEEDGQVNISIEY